MKSLLVTSCFFWGAHAIRAQCASANDKPAAQTPGLPAMPPTGRGFMSGAIDAHTFADMRGFGANIVRLQIYPIGQGRRYGGGKGFWDAWPVVLDSMEVWVRRAGAAGLKVVIDVHEAPLPGVPTDRSAFWRNPDLYPNFCRVWADIARRMLPMRSTIWGYDLYNEPLNRDDWPHGPSAWPPLAEAIARTIRTIDADTWLVYETGPGGEFMGFTGLKPLSDRRTVYGAHLYQPHDFTGQGTPGGPPVGSVHYPSVIGLKTWDRGQLESVVVPAVDFQRKYHVPIYIGEFSIIRWAPHDDAVRWLKDVISIFESHGWSWTYHAFREWNGWSVEYDDKPLKEGDPDPGPVPYVTDRAKALRDAFQANWSTR
jgi:aryl-phospho-beta-D-glucosidase BglC (GH1 family)